MKEILIGIIAGMITALGIGGGTILIILLTFICGMGQREAQVVNLYFFIPTAIIATICNYKNKNIETKIGIQIIIWGIIGSLIGVKIAKIIEVKNLKKAFGIFLLIIAIKEIYSILKMKVKE